jgi:hypothetical protein
VRHLIEEEAADASDRYALDVTGSHEKDTDLARRIPQPRQGTQFAKQALVEPCDDIHPLDDLHDRNLHGMLTARGSATAAAIDLGGGGRTPLYLSRRQLAALRRQRLEHWKISLWHSRCLLGAFSVGSSG